MSVTKEMVAQLAIQAGASIMIGDTTTDPMARKVALCQHVVDFYEWLRLLLVNPAWPTPVIDGSWLSAVIATGVAPTVPAPPVVPPVPVPVVPPVPLGSITPPAASKAFQEAHGLSKEMQGDPNFQKLLRIHPGNRSGN